MTSDPNKVGLDAAMEVGARRLYEGGKKEWLWLAILVCHGEGAPLPSWAIEALASGAKEIMQGRSDNWGDVFGGATELRGRGGAPMTPDPNKECLDAAMEEARRLYEGGKKEWLWVAILVCHVEGAPLPSWAIEALASGATEIVQGRSDNWGDVFGRPTELRGRRDRAYWRGVWGDRICTLVRVRIERKMPWLELWDDVANALRENHETQIRQDGRAPPSASTIRNIYYEMRPFEPVLDDDEQP